MKNTLTRKLFPAPGLRTPASAVALAALLVTGLTASAPAANSVWNGGTDGNFNTAGNWTPSGVPAAGATLEFPAGVTQVSVTNNLTGTKSYGGFTFDAGAPSYTLNGNSVTITLAGNGVTNNSSGLQTVNLLLRVYNGAASGVTYFNAASGPLTLGGGFNTGSTGVGWIVTKGTGGVTINGGIPASCGVSNVLGTLTMAPPGAFTTANAYTNNTVITGGTVKLGGPNVIPSGAGMGNVVLQPASGTATLDAGGQTNTVNGLASSGAGASLVDNSGGAGLLTVGAANVSSAYSGAIKNTSGTLALTKIGTGTLTLNGTNTYTGNTTISAGTLALGASASFAGSAVNLAAGATLDVSAQAGYVWGGSAGLTASGTGTVTGGTAATINGGTTVNLGTVPVTLNYTPTAFFGDGAHPALYVAAGNLTLNGPVTVNNNGASPLSVGTYTLIAQNGGSLGGSPTLSAVGGNGLVTGTAGGLLASGGNLFLVVTSTSPLTTSVTLARHPGTGAATTYGDALSFDVTVSPASATGTVLLKNDAGLVFGSGTLSAGACTISPAANALPAGTFTNLAAYYGGDINYAASVSTALSPAQTVAQLALTVSGVTVNDKIYDGTTLAFLNGTLTGVLSGDTVTFGTGTFAGAGPGTGLTVTAATTLGGASAPNYTLSSAPTGLTGNIYAAGVWTGLADGTEWNTAGNWTNNLIPAGTNVTADLSALGVTAGSSVSLGSPVLVGNLVFGNVAGDVSGIVLTNGGAATNVLTLAGTAPTITVNGLDTGATAVLGAAVAGSAGLNVAGAGTLDLAVANTYTGATTIGAGTLLLTGTGSLGSGNYAGPITNNGTFQYSSAGVQTLSGTISGTGMVTSTAGTLTLSASNTYSGGTTLSGGIIIAATNNALGTNMLTIGSSAQRLGIAGGVTLANPITINAASPGTGNAAINGADAGTSVINGPVTINGGSVHFGNNSGGTMIVNGPVTAAVPVGVRKGTVYLNGGGSYTSLQLDQDYLELGAGNGISTQAVVFVAYTASRTGIVYLNGFNQTLAGLTGPAAGSVAEVISSGTNAATLTLNTSGYNGYGGTIAGTNLSLVVTGTGGQTLSGNNPYGGSTTVSGGTLALSGSGAITNTPSISIASGAIFDVSGLGAWTLGAGQVLGGAGTVNGSMTVTGTVSPGTNISTLTFNNNLTLAGTNLMKITKQGGLTNDVLAVSGALTFGGTLQVVLTGSSPLAVNDTFALYRLGSPAAGTFTSVVLPAGYTWDTSLLATAGTIRVASLGAGPVIGGSAVTGGNFAMTGSGGTPGGTYYVLGTTNLSAPIVWQPVLTNTFDGGGNFSNAIPVDPAVPQVFYQLQLP